MVSGTISSNLRCGGSQIASRATRFLRRGGAVRHPHGLSWRARGSLSPARQIRRARKATLRCRRDCSARGVAVANAHSLPFRAWQPVSPGVSWHRCAPAIAPAWHYPGYPYSPVLVGAAAGGNPLAAVEIGSRGIDLIIARQLGRIGGVVFFMGRWAVRGAGRDQRRRRRRPRKSRQERGKTGVNQATAGGGWGGPSVSVPRKALSEPPASTVSARLRVKSFHAPVHALCVRISGCTALR